MKKVRVFRTPNGITINGKEYLLTEKNEIKLFDSIVEAKNYLKENGIKSFRGINFEEVEDD